MTTTYGDGRAVLHHGDCLDVLRELADCSIDAVVTDPPYGLEFMGKDWDGADGFRRSLNPADVGRDNAFGRTSATSPEYSTGRGARVLTERAGELTVRGKGHSTSAGPYLAGGVDSIRVAGRPFQDWCEAWSRECLRVLKPGGHMLAFGGARTWHRLACAVEDAGFEVRDSIAWLYGSGFPKSLNLTDDDGERTGWGTALKPAFEPIVVARKPLIGTVAANVLAHGTGALNIDGCRVETNEALRGSTVRNDIRGGNFAAGHRANPGDIADYAQSPAGRWPANVVLDESQADALDEQAGETRSRAGAPRQGVNGDGWGMTSTGAEYDDLGGASRFFHVAREDQSCLNSDPVNTVGSTTCPPSALADSAQNDAATSAHPDTGRPTDSPSTSATPTESRPSAESGTPPTVSTESESSPDWQPAKPSQMVSPARYAASLAPTDTTTTTTSPSTSDGSADLTTSDTMPSLVPGVPLDELGSRFTYVAKADSAERVRVNGTAHPTVKPLALMRWLVRLVTPPGGTVLEPFAGSGTTVEAALLEGFNCIAIEREADYLPLIETRIRWGLDPVLRRWEARAPRPESTDDAATIFDGVM